MRNLCQLFSYHLLCWCQIRMIPVRAFSLPSNFPPSFKKASSLCSVPPTPQNKRYIHALRLAVAETLRRNSRVLFPLEPNTMSFMLRVNTRRGARPVNQTMWRTCGGFCAWILLFLTDVCAQSQRRYKFLLSFTELILKEGSHILTRSWSFTSTGLNISFSSFDGYFFLNI